MATPDLVLTTLRDDARAWFDQARAQITADTRASLPVLLPQLPRRLGRDPFVTARPNTADDAGTAGTAADAAAYRIADARVDLGAWRACDAGALLLFQDAAAASTGVSDELLLDLYYHGDLEEKAMVLRVTTCLPITDATITLLGEAQRTNTSNHFEAAICDSNLLARAVGQAGFDLDGFNRTLLKLAFVDLPLARVLDAAALANEELSRMLQDLATEREAAGRRVWRDTNLLIARAPTAGTIARLAGGLEHGDDAHRLAAARGLAFVEDETLRALARQRLDREPVAAICTAIRAAIRAAI